MSNTIILKNGTTTPGVTDLEVAEPGFKKDSGTLYIGNGEKVVQINPIISPEEPERISGALWIDTSVESSTEESPLPILQGGTGANSAISARANLGAAPAGYGLGGNAVTIDSLDNAIGFGLYQSEQGTPMDAMYDCLHIPYSSGYATQMAFKTNSGNGVQMYVRKKNGGTWGEWVNDSPSAYAPAGYGLGGVAKLTTNLDTTTEGGWYYYSLNSLTSTSFPTGFGNGVMEVINRAGSQIIQKLTDIQGWMVQRVYVSGAWGEWEWVNPPLTAGVEYRTVEKVGGRPVYKYLFNYGYYTKGTEATVIPHGLSIYQPISIEITNNLTEVLSTSAGMKELSFNRTNVNLLCDWSMGNVHFIMKYTK